MRHALTLYDSMPQMLRRFSLFVLVVAALIAVEPVLHQHPLEQNSIPSQACAVCATGIGQLPAITKVTVALSRGEDKRALEAFRKALDVDPYLEKVPELVKTLSEKVEGRDI